MASIYNIHQTWSHQINTRPSFTNVTVVDKVPLEMLHLVDSYWYQFPPLNPLWHSFLGVTLTILGITCLLGNGMVIYIFSTTKSLRTPSNLLVVNLAFSDFLMMFTMFPPAVINCYNETWVFGPFMCQIYGCFGSLFGCVSIWTMTMISFDRYNVIVKGLATKPMTNVKAILWIFGVWINSLIWTVAPLFGWNRYVPEGNMAVCGTDYLSKDWKSRSYVLAYGIFVYFLPLILIVYSYYYIVKVVSKHERSMRDLAKKMNVVTLRAVDSATRNEFKLAKIALFTISLWFVAWTPYLIINFSGIFDLNPISPLATISGSLFAKANAVYNPIVYGLSHPKYRAALYKRFPALACQAPPEEIGSTASAVSNLTDVKTPA